MNTGITKVDMFGISGPEKADAPMVSEVGNGSSAGIVDDEEYSRIMARLDELEKEELEEEDTEEHEDDTRDEDFQNLVTHQTVIPIFTILRKDAEESGKIHISR